MSAELNATSLRRLKVAELRELCEERGLDVSGVKQALIDRLLAHSEQPTADDAPTSTTTEDASETVPMTVEADVGSGGVSSGRDSTNEAPVAAAATSTGDALDSTEAAVPTAPTPALVSTPVVVAATPSPPAVAVASPTAALQVDSEPAPASSPASTEAAPTSTSTVEPTPTPESAPRRIIKLTRKAPPPLEELSAADTKRARVSSGGLTPTAATSSAIPSSTSQPQQLSSSSPVGSLPPKPADLEFGVSGGGRHRASFESEEVNASSSLRVTGFKCPITMAQIESLLRSFGPVRSVSIPFIKNLALVTYETREDAREAAAALQGRTGFPDASHVELLSARPIADREVTMAAARAKALLGTGAATRKEKPQQKQPKPDRPLAAAAAAAARTTPESRTREAPSSLAEEQKESAAASSSSTTISTSRRVITLRGRQDTTLTPGQLRIEKRYDDADSADPTSCMVLDDEPPTLQLDELFRKTDHLPHLYWLPCTPEEIAKKKERREAEASRRREHRRSRSRSRSYSRSYSRSRSR